MVCRYWDLCFVEWQGMIITVIHFHGSLFDSDSMFTEVRLDFS